MMYLIFLRVRLESSYSTVLKQKPRLYLPMEQRSVIDPYSLKLYVGLCLMFRLV